MRYVIYGAGAVGGSIGGRLFESGRDVTLIARGEHGEAIRSGGLRLRSPDRDAVLDIPCVPHPSELKLTPEHVVVLSMKSQDTQAALDALAPVAPPDIAIVCAQNGVENERIALRLFERVYAMCVILPAEHLDPGRVDVSSAPISGILDIGRYPSGTDATAQEIVSDLEASTFVSSAEPSVMRNKYNKLLMNLGNALEAACGTEGRKSPLWRRARDEALACFAAAGIDAMSEKEEKAHRADHLTMRPIDGSFRGGGSSWQSLARGAGRIETDFLNGEVVLLGRLQGIPTPVNAHLQQLAGRMAREGAPPGSIDVADLEAALA